MSTLGEESFRFRSICYRVRRCGETALFNGESYQIVNGCDLELGAKRDLVGYYRHYDALLSRWTLSAGVVLASNCKLPPKASTSSDGS